eukprot:scaffold517462_cov48-Prasinocladus_malaysianus.AAC.1
MPNNPRGLPGFPGQWKQKPQKTKTSCPGGTQTIRPTAGRQMCDPLAVQELLGGLDSPTLVTGAFPDLDEELWLGSLMAEVGQRPTEFQASSTLSFPIALSLTSIAPSFPSHFPSEHTIGNEGPSGIGLNESICLASENS